MPIAEHMAWELESGNGHYMIAAGGRIDADLHNEHIIGGGFDLGEAAVIQEAAHMDLVDAEKDALATNVLTKLKNWANLSSTKPEEVGDARDDISTAREDSPIAKVKGIADTAGKVADKIGTIPEFKPAAKIVSKGTGAIHAAADIADAEQDYVNQQALDILKEAKAKKRDKKHCGGSNAQNADGSMSSAQPCGE